MGIADGIAVFLFIAIVALGLWEVLEEGWGPRTSHGRSVAEAMRKEEMREAQDARPALTEVSIRAELLGEMVVWRWGMEHSLLDAWKRPGDLHVTTDGGVCFCEPFCRGSEVVAVPTLSLRGREIRALSAGTLRRWRPTLLPWAAPYATQTWLRKVLLGERYVLAALTEQRDGHERVNVFEARSPSEGAWLLGRLHAARRLGLPADLDAVLDERACRALYRRVRWWAREAGT